AHLVQVVRAPQRRYDLDRDVHARGELLVRQLREQLDGERADPVEVEVDVVARQAELVEVGAYRLCRDTGVAQRRDRRTRGALRQLLAVGAEHEPEVQV